LRFLTVIFLSSCALSSAHADINIGIAGPLSGQNAGFGEELRTGVSAAIAEINRLGGINGENLALIAGDDNCDAKRATDVARDFRTKDVRLVVGHFCSSATLAAAPIYTEGGILVITPSATAPDITMKNLWNVFRLTGRDDMQADIAAQRISSSGQGAGHRRPRPSFPQRVAADESHQRQAGRHKNAG
jgi:branched-chain amino acid transport system substrate-binding protein